MRHNITMWVSWRLPPLLPGRAPPVSQGSQVAPSSSAPDVRFRYQIQSASDSTLLLFCPT